jgi:uncharacterized protein (DUF1330 family)
MKSRIAIAVGVTAGFILGAASIHTLHAQAKPPAFLVVEVDVTNAELFARDYAPKAGEMSRKYGGRVLAASNNVTTLSGAPAKRMAIVQHDSVEQIMAWNAAPEQQELRKVGESHARFRFNVLPGLPLQ